WQRKAHPVACLHGYRTAPAHLPHPRRSDSASARREEGPPRRAQSRDDPDRLSARVARIGVTGLRVSDLDLKRGTIYCRRAKNSRSSLHPLKPDEAAAVEKVLRERNLRTSDYVFQSERAAKLSRSAFWRVVAQSGERAGLPVKV